MNTQAYDLIGDIHGHHDKLIALLGKLGYLPSGDGFRHPEGRKVVFLGDYIDRGPKIREVLVTVRAMVESGDALAIMGNHEYNAVAYATPDEHGGHLRPHTADKVRQHAKTLAEFEGRKEEWAEWLEWFKGLPFFLELKGFRAVHACWAEDDIGFLRDKSLKVDAFLQTSAHKSSREFQVIERVLKGPELSLPDGESFEDKDGTRRTGVRARWWDLRPGLTFGEITMPSGMACDLPLTEDGIASLPNYGLNEPPVFFGHYWMPPETPKAPRAANRACLDFGAGLTGPLVAYRWNGERELNTKNFICHDQESN